MKKKKISEKAVVKKRDDKPKAAPSNNSFYVVGIGASAGGLEAIETFFSSMPENTGMAFIIVSHLDPTRISLMPELIQKTTKMKLYEARDGMTIEPDNVYVAPANRDLGILHGTIQLIEPHEAHGFRLPIDFFFKSLSADLGEKAICIILSGMASDGTAGLKAVKSELGMVMVQDPQTAKFDGMPNSAIKSGLADHILPPEKMPDQLMKYTSQKVKGLLLDKAITDGKMPDAFQKIFILLRTSTGHDFSHYKQNTISRRIERRLNVSQLDNFPNYIRLLQENPKEIENLFKDLLIGVTNFFRDPESFVKLKNVLLKIVKSKPDNDSIRIWVPGCSSGEEAYSIAILLKECLNETKKTFNVQIFATDIDIEAIEKARLGKFTGIESDVGNERLKKFFTSIGNIHQIRKEIREMLVFAPQSLIKDPPFTKLDLVSCRNLLIYFNSELQKQIIPLFHYSLLPEGILFLGSSETIGGFVDLFTMIEKKWKIYKRRDSIYSSTLFFEFPVSPLIRRQNEKIMEKKEVKNITQMAEKAILNNYSPDCLIATENGEIVYLHGSSGKYLELPHGEAKMNIFEMAREGLQQLLPALIRKVVSGKKPLSADGVKVKISGRWRLINITVKPVNEPAEMEGSLLIIFEEQKNVTETDTKNIKFNSGSAKIIKDLERELKSTKENLKASIGQLETSNEELKSNNEEMQSTNEEMQSSNEELVTSKEELQSLNEELITVNTELQNKNDELSIVNNDMKNLLDSTNIPTIFLNNDLLIKRFTFHATKVVNLISTDIGRPISHIATNIRYQNLIEDAEEVLRTLVFREVELQTTDGTWYQMRILPYRTIDNIIDGVVITFLNIDRLKNAYDEIRELNKSIQFGREYADNIVDTVRESLIILDEDLMVVSANRSFHKMFNTVNEKIVGKYIYEIEKKNWDIPELKKLLEQIIPKNEFFEDYEIEHKFLNGSKRKLLVNARQILHGSKGTKLILLAMQYKT